MAPCLTSIPARLSALACALLPIRPSARLESSAAALNNLSFRAKRGICYSAGRSRSCRLLPASRYPSAPSTCPTRLSAPNPPSAYVRKRPSQGTQPEGTHTEADASRKVREMFTQIAPSYDALNHLLSLQLDRLWRARVARRLRPILANPNALVLDLCCGTGDLALALRKSAKGKARIIGADFAHTVLVRARAKSILGVSHSGMPAPPPLPAAEADALRHLPSPIPLLTSSPPPSASAI